MILYIDICGASDFLKYLCYGTLFLYEFKRLTGYFGLSDILGYGCL